MLCRIRRIGTTAFILHWSVYVVKNEVNMEYRRAEMPRNAYVKS